MSSVFFLALSGLNSAQQQQLHAARTISLATSQPPAEPEISGYGPAPRDRVDISGSAGQPQPASYAPPTPATRPSAGGQQSDPSDDISSALVQSLVARYSFAANAKVLSIANRTLKTLIDITA
jgi:hypothetical protein